MDHSKHVNTLDQLLTVHFVLIRVLVRMVTVGVFI